ncbi:MAG TPA: M20 family metallo-hydrolase [Verrucomicrobiae bacterium]|nr:M20 family metallo-hydrolase [Verrucomicrobiae bacterium]
MKPALEIDIGRLSREIEELALISENPPPVVTRVLFSDADLKARAHVKELCRQARLNIREDAVGNIFARWEGRDDGAPAIGTGSHIDAIPNAGKYDGVVGVLGGLEAIRSLQRSGFQPGRSIELIIFTAEEPTRFGIGCLGSRIMAGALSDERIAALRSSEGHDFDYWRQRAGIEGDVESARFDVEELGGFIELHIEQGPVLEREKLDIGIVEKIAAPSSLRLRLTGVGGHAGAVLMPERHDALVAGAEIALAVEQAALTSGSADMVATTGVFRIEPGAINSVPCGAHLEIDLRDTDAGCRDAALAKIETAAKEICGRRGIELQLERINVDAPAICDRFLVKVLGLNCQDLNFSCMKLISRAYHDTLFMARICPSAMIFIPCRGGVSHRPDEYSAPEQIGRGVKLLAETLRLLAV